MTPDRFDLPLALWVTPSAKLLKKILRKSEARAVDLEAFAGPLFDALGTAEGVDLRMADLAIDQGQLAARCAHQPDEPFPMEDVAGIVIAALHRSEAASTLIPCREAVLEALPSSGGRALPASGFLLVASGAQDAVLAWYEAALRRFRVPGSAIMARPGYRPSSRGPSGIITKGELPPALRAALAEAASTAYKGNVLIIPMRPVVEAPASATA